MGEAGVSPTRERLRLAAVAAAGVALVALVGIVSVVWAPAPSELTYSLVADEDGNVGVQSLSGAAVEPAVQPAGVKGVGRGGGALKIPLAAYK